MEGNTLGTRIAERLQDLHMTQKELAQRAEVTEAAVSHYIKGDRYPRSSVLARIAESLETTADYLMGGSTQNRTDIYNYYRDVQKYPSHDLESASVFYKKAKNIYEFSEDQQYRSEDLDIAAKLITRNLSQMTQEDKLKIMEILLVKGDENTETKEENRNDAEGTP